MSTSKSPRKMARKRAAKPRASAPDATRLLHELEVHQAELESQNEELLRARRELELALARYTDLFDFAPIGYATIDAEDVIRNVNHVGARLLGSNRARIVGARFGAMLIREDVAALNAVVSRVRSTAEPAACDVRIRGSEDTPSLVLHLTATPEPREPRALLLAFEDITLLKAEQEQLAATEQALRETNDRKDEFLAMLSHELRNPLAPIRMCLFTLSRSEAGSAASIGAREIIDRQVTHLTRLVDDLLDMTRISRGKIQLKREVVELVELVHRTVEDHRPACEAGGIAVAVSLSPDPIWVDVDPARIIQAVSNVLGNAQKFTPSGERIEVDLHCRNGRAELRIRDTGAGIAPEVLPHVFEPFMQAPQTLDRSRGGLGLGLAMVKGLIELHGGSVRIASKGIGRGVEVVIVLETTRPGESLRPAAMPSLRSRRVLVIEDHPDAARVLETALQIVGFEVRIASDGPTGIALARVFHPEVVLCDVGLPGMDGHEVARAFRRDRALRDIYLVALSGYAQPADVERAILAGFSRHIAKPASLDTLVRVIADAP
jgi:PAS domain S-box-containing protein